MAITLADICTTGYGFINEEFAAIICQILEIELQCLIESKQIQKFDDIATKLITHAIYLILTIYIYTKSFTFVFPTKLGNYPIIFSSP